MGEPSNLPESESALYELATRSDEDQCPREAVIKKLGSLNTEASERRLGELTEQGVSPVERQLAQKYTGISESEHTSDSISNKQADTEPTELESKLQQENKQFREALSPSGDNRQETDDGESD